MLEQALRRACVESTVEACSLPHPMADDRKTLEQRSTMSDIERLRHSAAHVLSTAILRIWPEAQFADGP